MRSKSICAFLLLFMAWNVYGQTRTLLTSDQNLYVNCSTGSDSNPGTASQPFLTLAKAYNHDQQNWDHAGQYVTTVTVQANCSGVATTVSGPLVGANGPQSFVYNGAGLWSTVITGATGGYAFQAQHDASFSVQNISCYPGPGGGCFLSNNGVIAISNIGFVTNSGNSLGDAAGPRSLLMVGAIGIASGGGNVNIAFVAEDHAQINMNGPCSFAGAPTWTTAFVQADLGGMIDATGFSYSGGFPTGVRYNAVLNGIVFTGGGGSATFFPGSSAGVVNSGGIYR